MLKKRESERARERESERERGSERARERESERARGRESERARERERARPTDIPWALSRTVKLETLTPGKTLLYLTSRNPQLPIGLLDRRKLLRSCSRRNIWLEGGDVPLPKCPRQAVKAKRLPASYYRSLIIGIGFRGP